ncbi:MAG: hypothetical protein ACE5LF_06995 [Alphaproteobacteria bacterium]
MPSTRQVVTALYGAWRLLRFDTGGMAWFDVSLPGFWRSFFAAVLVAPGFAVLIALRLAARSEPYDLGWTIVVSTVAYGVGWVAFPIVAVFITRLLALTDRYFALIIALNWASVPQMLVFVPVVLIDAGGLLPMPLGPVATIAATLFVIAYQWFVIRTALATDALTASGVVVLQLVIDGFVEFGADSLI